MQEETNDRIQYHFDAIFTENLPRLVCPNTAGLQQSRVVGFAALICFVWVFLLAGWFGSLVCLCVCFGGCCWGFGRFYVLFFPTPGSSLFGKTYPFTVSFALGRLLQPLSVCFPLILKAVPQQNNPRHSAFPSPLQFIW